MLYEKELVQYKSHTFNPEAVGLQIFDSQRQLLRSNREKYWHLLRQYGQRVSSLHGLRYVLAPKLRGGVRFFWAVVVLWAFLTCMTTYVNLSIRHYQQQLRTVVETTQLPIYRIEFPGVAVCLLKNVNWQRLDAAEKRFVSSQRRTELRSAFRHLLLILELLDFRDFGKLSEFSMQKALLQMVDGINLTELATFLAFRCDEVLLDCYFDGSSYDCCKLFVLEHTERGICLAFNSLTSAESKKKKLSDTFYPWKIGKAGEGSGLKFTLRNNGSSHNPANDTRFMVNLMIKEPAEWSEPITHPLYKNTQNLLSIWPQMTETSNNTRDMNPYKRRCLFDEENLNQYGFAKGLSYSRQNCHALCMQRHLLDVCNCTMSLFFPILTEEPRECRPLDLNCIFENRDIFGYIKTPSQDEYIKDARRGLICNCIENCYSVEYLHSVNSRKMMRTNRSDPIIKVDIHYGQRVMTKYVTELEYIDMDLLAHFGGVLGLFMGASMLSLTELLYIFIKVTVMFIRDRRINWKQVKRLKLHLKPRTQVGNEQGAAFTDITPKRAVNFT